MSVNSVGASTAMPAISKQLVEQEQKPATSSIMSSSETEANTKKDIRLEERMEQVADIISEEGKTKSQNGATGSIIGIAGTTLGASVAIVAGILHAPLVAIGAGVIGLGSLIGGIIGTNAVNKGEIRQNEANNYINSPQEENNTIPEKIANAIWGNNTDALPSKDTLSDAAVQLEDESNGIYTDIYIYNSENISDSGETINQNAILGHVDIVRTNLQEYDGKTTQDGKYVGYSANSYVFAKEYTQVLNTFNTQTAQDGKLTASETQKLENIANALQNEGFSDEKAIFDVNSDGYMNTADLLILNNLAQGTIEKLSQTISTWESTGNLPTGEVENVYDFDVNKDGQFNKDDMQYFQNISNINQANCDINGDGKIDGSDTKILQSYLKANMDRLIALEKESEEIRSATFEDGKVSDEYKKALMGV